MIGGVAVTGGDVAFAGEITGDFPCIRCQRRQGPLQAQYRWPNRGRHGQLRLGRQTVRRLVSGFVGGYYYQMAPEIGGGNPTITVFALKP